MDVNRAYLLTRLFVANYYLSGLVFGVAGVIKFNGAGVSELLQFYFDNGFIGLDHLVLISKNQPLIEVALGFIALFGLGARYVAYGMAVLYLFFAGLIAYASGGFLLLPIDCGCFGEGEGTMALLLILRNGLLGCMLFAVPKDLYRYTFYHFLKRSFGNAV